MDLPRMFRFVLLLTVANAAVACNTESPPAPTPRTDSTAEVRLALADLSLAVDEDETLAFTLEAEIDGTDEDPNWSVETPPAHGSITGQGPAFVYTPEQDFHGSDTIAISVSLDPDVTATATIRVTVHPVNDAPVAHSGAVATAEDTPYNGVLTGSDIDSDLLTFSIVTHPEHGSLTTQANGNFEYLPDPDYFGSDAFVFQAFDGELYSAPATIQITVTPVNDAPLAWPSFVTTAEDTPYNGVLTGNDIDSGVLTFSIVTHPEHGSLASQANGNFEYLPDPDYFGSDAFVFQAFDGELYSAPATVAIDVTPVNDPPVVESITLRTLATVPAPGIVPVTDPDTPAGNVTVEIAQGSGGTATWDDVATRSVSFAPTAGFAGVATFATRASDGEWTSTWAEHRVFVIPARRVAGSGNYACGATHTTGELYCWGNGNLGRGSSESSTTPVQESGMHTGILRLTAWWGSHCALDDALRLWCWGSNVSNRLGIGSGTNVAYTLTALGTAGWIDATLGNAHGCGLRADGSMYCWGANTSGQVGVPGSSTYEAPEQLEGSTWVAVAAGNNSTCGVQEDGSLWCWGGNNQGQLGLPRATVSSAATPTRVGNDNDWLTVFAGTYHACGVKTDHTLWCWGSGFNGENGSNEILEEPTRLGNDANWAWGDAGGGYSCGLRIDGTLWCWGSNYDGESGIGYRVGGPVPAQVGTATGWTAVSAKTPTCGERATGAVFCWGANNHAQAGIPHFSQHLTPARLGNATWESVSGQDFACGLQGGGTLWCWGDNWDGEFGNGRYDNVPYPAEITQAGSGWAVFGAGESSAYAIHSDGTLWSTGRNNNGQLGSGDTSSRRAEWLQETTERLWSTNPKALGTSDRHACAIGTDDRIYCWGFNFYHQASTSTDMNITTATAVSATADWAAASVGWGHSCGIKLDGSLWCWGVNEFGQLGIGEFEGPDLCGSTACASSPREVSAGTGYTTVSAGLRHTCAIRTDGTLWCWGGNWNNVLGIETAPEACLSGAPCATTPIQIGTASDWLDVVAGRNHSCGLRGDGISNDLYCWGGNNYGQLGVGDTTSRSTPEQVDPSGPSDWTAVEIAQDGTFGLRDSGALWAWGRDNYGSLGMGTAYLMEPGRVSLP